MTIMSDPENADTIGALARARWFAVEKTNALLQPRDGETPAATAERISGISALLVSSLEELKVAEEELRQQSTALIEQRAANDERTRHYRQLFLFAPVPLIVTDIFGTIHEANHGARHLFHREPEHLKRKPMAVLIPTVDRDEFRRRLARLLEADGPKEWSLNVVRNGDVPVRVRALVTRVPDIGPTGSGMLYWLIWPEKANQASEDNHLRSARSA
jgi:PAS domain S-box-containing protein